MSVKIGVKNFDVEMELKTKGIEFEIHKNTLMSGLSMMFVLKGILRLS
jgi:hypothetical protein